MVKFLDHNDVKSYEKRMLLLDFMKAIAPALVQTHTLREAGQSRSDIARTARYISEALVAEYEKSCRGDEPDAG